jgi:hypothetical protein
MELQKRNIAGKAFVGLYKAIISERFHDVRFFTRATKRQLTCTKTLGIVIFDSNLREALWTVNIKQKSRSYLDKQCNINENTEKSWSLVCR